MNIFQYKLTGKQINGDNYIDIQKRPINCNSSKINIVLYIVILLL
eukprot:UN20989